MAGEQGERVWGDRGCDNWARTELKPICLGIESGKGKLRPGARCLPA